MTRSSVRKNSPKRRIPLSGLHPADPDGLTPVGAEGAHPQNPSERRPLIPIFMGELYPGEGQESFPSFITIKKSKHATAVIGQIW